MSENPTFRRAEEAIRLLSSPVFTEAFRALDVRQVEAWRRGKTQRERETAHMRQQALADVQGMLREFVKKASDAETRATGNRNNVFKAFLQRLAATETPQE